jgi:hypothetical protein
MQNALGGIGDGRFSRTREPAHPDHHAALAELVLLVFALEKSVKLGVNVRLHSAIYMHLLEAKVKPKPRINESSRKIKSSGLS